ncbi:retromer subunit PEP8 SCDLUD_003570 [Saccharomycodes ludwigii]|uniref:retromer subunit PEP8 n=1 Tax=Saccharomycodes ludwigii TaxID=36035 RepID=UPI001E859C3D|nr:hypothetical protein SCDLUD_003570 [Saccharomycodes ludwigii]KAH3900578.1 hypothetical protein SCDLUD_003570 [Saccharomycodes ludwigii]
MSSFFKPPIDIELLLDGEENRKYVEIPNKKQGITDRFNVYDDGESVSGIVTLRVRSEGKKVEHMGVKISLIGCIDMRKNSEKRKSSESPLSSNDKAHDTKSGVDQFLCLTADLLPSGELVHSQNIKFSFKDVEKRYESYKGTNVEVMYYLKVTVLRKAADLVKIKRFWVQLYESMENYEIKPIRLDIGIENCLHIEFEYSKQHYTLSDVIVGRIYFLLTRLKIKHMELSLITREKINRNNKIFDSNTIRYEIMDGSPVKGETIPIRLFLSGYDLVPNMNLNYFSVKHYLSLVIIDEDSRRYFKQSEIFLHRTRD